MGDSDDKSKLERDVVRTRLVDDRDLVRGRLVERYRVVDQDATEDRHTSEASSDLVMTTLLNIRGDIGELKALQLGANVTLSDHTAADRASFAAIDARLNEIEKVELKRKVAIGIWGMIATFTAGAGGILADFLRK
jgi:hypothetical protein